MLTGIIREVSVLLPQCREKWLLEILLASHDLRPQFSISPEDSMEWDCLLGQFFKGDSERKSFPPSIPSAMACKAQHSHGHLLLSTTTLCLQNLPQS